MSKVTPPTSEICRQHLSYMIWADRALLSAVQENIPQRSEVLTHIFMAERIWLARLEDSVTQSLADPPPDMEALTKAWGDLHRRWEAWAQDADFGKSIAYKNMAGAPFSSPLWQIVLHLANHGSYHRGQVAAMLRAEGFTPPSTDLIIWYRSFTQSATVTPEPPSQS